MSDDLISRKTLLEEIDSLQIELTGISCLKEFRKTVKEVLTCVKHIIDDQPTAFDKERVRRKLIELRNEEIYKPDSINKYTEARSQGRYSAFLDAIRIVEKGGIK